MKLGITRTPEDDDAGPALDLAQAIEEFFQEFPEHKNDVFILNHQKFKTGKEAIEDIAPALEEVKRRHPEAKLGMSKSMAMGAFEGKLPMSVSVTESMFTAKPDTQVFARIVIPAGDEFTARVLKSIFVAGDPIPNTRFPAMPPAHNNTQMWQRYVLDHELGHAVTVMNTDIREGKHTSIVNRRECEADAYAMIRHYQRYGENSAFPAYIRDVRNMNAVQKGDIGHWTSRALDKVIALNKKGKLKNLSPAQARDLAVAIAARTALSADAEHNMQQAFAQTVRQSRDAFKNKTSEGDRVMDYMAAVCRIGAETQSPAVHECCVRYMQAIGSFLPKGDMPMTKTQEQLKAMANDNRAMHAHKPASEPEMTGLKRIFRDAQIDAKSQPPSAPEAAKPQARKPKKGGNFDF